MLTAIDKMSAVVNDSVRKSEKSLVRLRKEADGFARSAQNIGTQTGALGLAIGAPLVAAVLGAEEAQTAFNRLDQVFRSMGETSGKAAIEAQKFAQSLMLEIAVDDVEILAAQAKLATFENVIKNAEGTSEIFERATRAAFDLQAAGFGEGTQNAVQLGKALQDPIKGMTALSRSGVTFTAQEKEKIKTMVESGKMLDAQRYLLAAVEKQVGGVAAATADDSVKFKLAMGEMLDVVGEALLPALASLTDTIVNGIVPAVKAFAAENPNLVKWLALGAAAFAGLMLVISAGSFIFSGIATAVGLASSAFAAFGAVLSFVAANPILLVIAAIALAAYLIYDNWEAISAWFANLWESVTAIFSKTWEWIKNLFLNYTPHGLIIKHWDTITAWFSGLWERFKGVLSSAWEGIKSFLLNYTPHGLIYTHWDAITAWFGGLWDRFKGVLGSAWEGIKSFLLNYTPHGLIYQHWDAIVGWFGSLWDRVTGKFLGWFDWLAGVPSRMLEAGANIVQSIWDGMASKFDAMISWFEGKVQALRDFLPFSPAKRGPLSDIHRLKLVETIAANIKPGPMVRAMDAATGSVRAAIPTTTGLGGGGAAPVGGGQIVVNFQPTINMNGSAATGPEREGFLNLLRQYQPELLRIVEEAVAQRMRTAF